MKIRSLHRIALIPLVCLAWNVQAAERVEPQSPHSAATAGIHVDWPVSRMVVQRSSSNVGVIHIRGNCLAKAERLEARLVPRLPGQGTSSEWIAMAVEGDAFEGKVSGAGGWYDLEIRARVGDALVATCVVRRVGIGEVFVVVGHSVAAGGQDENMEGAEDDRVSTVALNREIAAHQDYLRTGDADYLPEPGFAHYGTGVIPAPFGSGNYFWAKFGEHVARKQNVPILIFNAAFGGTSLEHWAKSAENVPFEHSFVKSSIRMPYINLSNTLRKYVSRTGLRAILSDQGQNDWPEQNEDLIFQNYMNWIRKARKDLDFPELAIIVNQQTPFLRDRQIRRVQERVTRTPYCFAGPDYDTLPKEARPDDIHLGVAGQSKAAELWAESLDDTFFARSKPFLPTAHPGGTGPIQPSAGSAAGPK